MAAQNTPAPTILRRRQVEARIGLSRSTIYDRLNPKTAGYDPTFPKPIGLGITGGRRHVVGWIESEIDAWLAAQVEKSRKATRKETAQPATEGVAS